MGHIKYLDCDSLGINRVGCMKCNKTVGQRRYFKGEGQEYGLVHGVNSKRFNVILADGSICGLIVCEECIDAIAEVDFPALEKTLHTGWEDEFLYKMNESRKKEDKEASKRFKEKHNLVGQVKELPTQVRVAMLLGKKIIRRG